MGWGGGGRSQTPPRIKYQSLIRQYSRHNPPAFLPMPVWDKGRGQQQTRGQEVLDTAEWVGKGQGQAEMGQAHQILVQNLREKGY